MAFFYPAAEKQGAEHRNNVFRTLHGAKHRAATDIAAKISLSAQREAEMGR